MTAASAAVSGSAASAGRIPTPADLDPSPGPVDVRTALALLGLPGALELGDDDARAAGARALDAARGADLTTAEAAAQALAAAQVLNTQTAAPDYRFYVSDIPLRFQTIGERFLGRSLEQIEMLRLG